MAPHPSPERPHHRAGTLTLLVGAALAFLSPATATAGTFTPPEGCEGWLTVQQRSCRVSNHYRCQASTPGDQWRVDFGVNGASYRGRIDYETQWVESHNSDGSVVLLEEPAQDPASFTELLATGEDIYIFSTQGSDGTHRNIEGFDRLTGANPVIDGVQLMQTKYEARASTDDGSTIWHAKGFEYIHPEWRIFLSGTGQVNLGEGFLPQDFTPMEFALPGDTGFMTTIPLYDCAPMTVEGDRPKAATIPVSLRLGATP